MFSGLYSVCGYPSPIQNNIRTALTSIDINAFFNDWYNALNFATTNTTLSINPIVTAVDPDKTTSIAFGDVLSALIAGLPFIGAPAFSATIAASTSAQALVTGLQQAPGLVKALWPTGSPEVQNSHCPPQLLQQPVSY